MKTRRIALVYPVANLDSVPSLYNAVVLWAEHGYWVDVFTSFSSRYVRPSFQDEKIAVLPVDRPPRRAQGLPWRIMPWRWYVRVQLWRRHLRAPYVCVIGADPQGLVWADWMARQVAAPVAYWSLELFLSYEVSTDRERDLKALERDLSRRSEFVVIQDEERGDLLRRDNGLSPERIIKVPNSPLGQAQFRRSDYLRRKYGLPSETKIILHSGSIGAWAGTHQLMRSTHGWPKDWVLVCHTRNRAVPDGADYLAALEYIAKPGRVIFSTDPLPHAEYDALVQSADLGVVYYCPMPGSWYTQDNIRHIGLSSGKLAYCLQNGVPVVVNDLPSLRRLVGQYRCGEMVEDPGTNSAAIARIIDDYPAYCRGAVQCFDRELSFAEPFRQVIRAIEAFPTPPRPAAAALGLRCHF